MIVSRWSGDQSGDQSVRANSSIWSAAPQRQPLSDPIRLRLDDPTQLPSLVIRSLPRSREGFVICCRRPTLEDKVRLSARLDVDRAEVRQSDDDLLTLHTHIKPTAVGFILAPHTPNCATGETSPYAYPNSWLAPIRELYTRGLEHLTEAINRPLAYCLATLKPNNGLQRHLRGYCQFPDAQA